LSIEVCLIYNSYLQEVFEPSSLQISKIPIQIYFGVVDWMDEKGALRMVK